MPIVGVSYQGSLPRKDDTDDLFYSNNCNDLHIDRRTVWRSGVQ